VTIVALRSGSRRGHPGRIGGAATRRATADGRTGVRERAAWRSRRSPAGPASAGQEASRLRCPSRSRPSPTASAPPRASSSPRAIQSSFGTGTGQYTLLCSRQSGAM